MVSRNKGFRQPGSKELDGETKKLLKLFKSDNHRALEEEARRFVSKYPNHIFGRKALGVSLTMQSKFQDALAVTEQAVLDYPHDTELRNNLSAILLQLGRHEDAIACAEEAIRLFPNNGAAYANKGLALKGLGAWTLALDSYRKALELDPADHISFNNVGVALLESEQAESAIPCFEAALAISPNYNEARLNLAHAQTKLSWIKDSIGQFKKILDNNPENDGARSSYSFLLHGECDFIAARQQSEILLERIKNDRINGNLATFGFLSCENTTLEIQQKAARQHAEFHFATLLKREPLAPPTTTRNNKQRLRIGYLSADFHHHATAMLMIGVLESRNTSIDTYCYSYGIDDCSPLRIRIEEACTEFHNIRPLSFLDAAQLIAKDEIDILVDLKGYTKDQRLEICALRPAPVIVSWLGYPGTLGHPKMADYIIGDPVVTPLEHQPFYSETIAQMPYCYQPNDNQREMGPKPSMSELGLPENGIVFCAFTQPYKISPTIFQQWCRLLNTVSGSVLWLMVEKDTVRERLLAEAARHGTSPSSFVFASSIHITKHLGRLQNADLALDTFPYGSHTTGSDALWAGVPLIAIKGNTFASRVSSSLLENVGLPELITDSPQAACDLAIALAADKPRLARIKAQLAATKYECHLFNTVEFTRDLERMYQTIWERHQAGDKAPIVLTIEPPAHFD